MKRKRPPYDNVQIKEEIERKIHSARDRQILTRSLCDDVGYEAIAAEMGMSRSQIARIVPRGEKILFVSPEG